MNYLSAKTPATKDLGSDNSPGRLPRMRKMGRNFFCGKTRPGMTWHLKNI
jgi:hypothetical protein